ncbi:MAG: methyltransferase domain-containing protein [Pseudomonadota bacterium]
MDVPKLIDRDLLVRRRNRHASGMADVRFLLDRVMDDVVERLAFVNRTFSDVLALGAYGGETRARLRDVLPEAKIVEADAALNLLSHPTDSASVLADEEALPFEADSFDLVVAPLTLHLTNDLPGALAQLQTVLRPDGLLLGAILGGRTLEELADAMLTAEAELFGTGSLRVVPKTEVRPLGALLQRAGFALPVVDGDLVTVTYPTPIDLMREIRAMGASNMLVERSRVPMTRGLLMRACEIYVERYGTPDGRVAATFEVLVLTGWAPHPDQQKPLKPGTATHRLADALGVPEQTTGQKAPQTVAPQSRPKGR